MKRAAEEEASLETKDLDTEGPKTFPEKSVIDPKEYWREKRKDIKATQKDKKKLKKDAFQTKEEYVQTDLHKQTLAKQKIKEKWKKQKIEDIQFHFPEVVLDLSYGPDMTPKDRASTVTQLHHLYGALRSSERPLKTHITSVQGEFEEKLNTVGIKGWKVFPHSEPFHTLFNKADLVYLSPDSPNALETIDPKKVYVIGGLVDHNHAKGLSQKRASELDIYTAKLPLSKYLQDYPNKSLNANHVFQILMDVAHHGNWQKALEDYAPKRKGYRKIPNNQIQVIETAEGD